MACRRGVRERVAWVVARARRARTDTGCVAPRDNVCAVPRSACEGREVSAPAEARGLGAGVGT
ncbi:MAG: hypothetical protein M3070_18040, partial [Actinomycetota bacterium]|nr:hypothetical protein [Actinomycetota bacterium]